MSSNTFKDNSSALGNPPSPSCSFLFTWGLASPQGMHTRKRWPTKRAFLPGYLSTKLFFFSVLSDARSFHDYVIRLLPCRIANYKLLICHGDTCIRPIKEAS